MAFVDLIACNATDCAVKLVGMESIIDLDYEKEKGSKLKDIHEFIERLIEREKTVKRKKDPKSFEIFIFPENHDEAGVGFEKKNEMSLYSPKKGGIYKFLELRKCIHECFCEWCVNSGFQKAFAGLRVVKVCLAIKGQVDSLSPVSDIFENSNNILRGIIRRSKIMVNKMNTFYVPLLTSEVDEINIQGLEDCDSFSYELGSLSALYVRFMLNMIEFHLQEWECSDASRNDLLTKGETLISVAEEEARNVKCLFEMQCLAYHTRKLKIIVERAKNVVFINIDEPDEFEEEFRLSSKGRAEVKVCVTPTKDITSAPQLKKMDIHNGDGGGDINYEPIPFMPGRKLPRQNLELNFKVAEEKQLKSRSMRAAGMPVSKLNKAVMRDPSVSKPITSAPSITKPRKVIGSKSELKKVTEHDANSGKTLEGVAIKFTKKINPKNNDNESSACDIVTRRKPDRKM